ncbi:BTB/POZ domain-containing protein 10 [Elysia marginata]|uniref:BTB/POZ domain-containing protein 10 n=1 Tax=Elysia marginata TaxID=1093978 RepID=A0AAV4G7H5_9GAST|nr:BTB/POZ domain-containing protein 10 [Elysia marginata]
MAHRRTHPPRDRYHREYDFHSSDSDFSDTDDHKKACIKKSSSIGPPRSKPCLVNRTRSTSLDSSNEDWPVESASSSSAMYLHSQSRPRDLEIHRHHSEGFLSLNNIREVIDEDQEKRVAQGGTLGQTFFLD